MSFHAPPPPTYLLPQNRKLRHLRGVYLRNLTFPQPRKYSVDDATINKSPEKREALRHGSAAGLHHALSSDNLRADKSRARRTTLSGANALARQHILEQALEGSSADAFFSMHGEGLPEPIYVSEVEERAMNFNFRFFDLSEMEPFISRSAQLTIKIWVRRILGGPWTLLVEDDIDLRFLGVIGPLQTTHFPPNSIVFHLLDGIYMAGASSSASSDGGGLKKQAPALPTSSYNALIRMANLENSIQDCLATQDKLEAQIDANLAKETAPELPEAEARQRRVAKGLTHQTRITEAARKKRNVTVASIQARRVAIAAGRSLQETAWADVEYAANKLASSRATAAKTADDIRGQRRRICEDLIRIFSIIPVPSGAPLSFQICGFTLPNTDYAPSLTSASAGEDTLSAALGYVALLVNALQNYLCVALPYRVTAYGSRSYIRDDISKIPDQQRDFPLHIPRGGLSSQYRFDYAWFLLNKNIETLCSAQGLRVVDIRHTLPNLKYLLYVCSAGTEELPERKRGGVRGLWMGHIQRHSVASVAGSDGGASTKSMPSRRSSIDAHAISQKQQKSIDLPRVGNGNPAESGIARGLALLPKPTLNLPFDDEAPTWTLRTKGMRENADN